MKNFLRMKTVALSSLLMLSAWSAGTAKAADNSDMPISALKFLNHLDTTIQLTDRILVKRGEKQVLLHKSDQWQCGLLLKSADPRDDRSIVPREVRVKRYFDADGESRDYLRRFVWTWGEKSSGLTYSEVAHAVTIVLDDPTMDKIQCISPEREDGSTLGDLEDVVAPFDLGLPQKPKDNGGSSDTSVQKPPKDA